MTHTTRNTKRPLWHTLAALTISASTHAAHAETLEGFLEKGPVWSSLTTFSQESGDSIGQVFRNQSPVGKTIFSNCLPDMPCQIEQGQRRNLDAPPAQEFKTQASGWFEITAAKKPHMVASISETESTVKTRQGQLTVADDNTLRLRGKPVLPQIQGNNFLGILMHYEIGNQDVVLLQNSGGSACPALYQFVILQAGSAKATPEFGSCSDITSPRWDGKNTVTLDMLGYAGPMNSEKEQRQAAMTKETYTYTQGRVMHKGKEIKP